MIPEGFEAKEGEAAAAEETQGEEQATPASDGGFGLEPGQQQQKQDEDSVGQKKSVTLQEPEAGDAEEKASKKKKKHVEEEEDDSEDDAVVSKLSSARRRTMFMDLASKAAKEEEEAEAAGDLPRLEVDEAEWPTAVLTAIQQLVTTSKLRVSDLIRGANYNPGYFEHDDESLDAGQMKAMVAKAGYFISTDQATTVVSILDANGDGVVNIDELRCALSMNRREHPSVNSYRAMVLGRGSSPNSPPPSRSRSKGPGLAGRTTEECEPPPKRIVQLYEQHARKQKAREEAKKRAEAMEDKAILDRKAQGRLGSRAKIDPESLKKSSWVKNRLPEIVQKEQQHREELEQKHYQEEQERLQAARFHAEPLHCTPHVPEHDEDFGKRLHAQHQQLVEKRMEQQLAATLEKLQECSPTQERSFSETKEIAERLFSDARDREERLQAIRDDKLKKEIDDILKSQVHKNQKGPCNMERLRELHEEQLRRIAVRKQLLKDAEDNEIQMLRHQKQQIDEECRKGRPAELLDAAPRYHLPKPMLSRSSSVSTFGVHTFETSMRTPHRPVEVPVVDSRDLVLATLNEAAALRCGAIPEECPLPMLCTASDLLGKVLDVYWDADQKSDMHGGLMLAKRQCQRLYTDGHLMDSTVGMKTLQEPDEIRQCTCDLDQLYTSAIAAQRQLLEKFEPKEVEGKVFVWKEGFKVPQPRRSGGALFAYNPGVKGKQSAERKARVLYEASAGKEKYFHLLDLARIALVYENAAVLSNAIDVICKDFDVVQVRNFYHPSCRNLLGERYVEIQVVVTENVDLPHVCEIRLEELCYFDAQRATRVNVNNVMSLFAQAFCAEGTDDEERPNAKADIEYVVKSTFLKPRVSRSHTRFLRKVATRCTSLIGAWRFNLGNDCILNFATFKDFCSKVNCLEGVVEFWQYLDPTFAGYISIFDWDPDSVALLVQLWDQLVDLAEDEAREPQARFGSELISKWSMLSQTRLASAHGDTMTAKEFISACRYLNFSQEESTRLLNALGSRGDNSKLWPDCPPLVVTGHDLEWLEDLCESVNTDAIWLASPRVAPIFEADRQARKTAKRLEPPGPWAKANILHVLKAPTFIPEDTLLRSVSPHVSPRELLRNESETDSHLTFVLKKSFGQTSMEDCRLETSEFNKLGLQPVSSATLPVEVARYNPHRLKGSPSSGSTRSRSPSPQSSPWKRKVASPRSRVLSASPVPSGRFNYAASQKSSMSQLSYASGSDGQQPIRLSAAVMQAHASREAEKKKQAAITVGSPVRSPSPGLGSMVDSDDEADRAAGSLLEEDSDVQASELSTF